MSDVHDLYEGGANTPASSNKLAPKGASRPSSKGPPVKVSLTHGCAVDGCNHANCTKYAHFHKPKPLTGAAKRLRDKANEGKPRGPRKSPRWQPCLDHLLANECGSDLPHGHCRCGSTEHPFFVQMMLEKVEEEKHGGEEGMEGVYTTPEGSIPVSNKYDTLAVQAAQLMGMYFNAPDESLSDDEDEQDEEKAAGGDGTVVKRGPTEPPTSQVTETRSAEDCAFDAEMERLAKLIKDHDAEVEMEEETKKGAGTDKGGTPPLTPPLARNAGIAQAEPAGPASRFEWSSEDAPAMSSSTHRTTGQDTNHADKHDNDSETRTDTTLNALSSAPGEPEEDLTVLKEESSSSESESSDDEDPDSDIELRWVFLAVETDSEESFWKRSRNFVVNHLPFATKLQTTLENEDEDFIPERVEVSVARVETSIYDFFGTRVSTEYSQQTFSVFNDLYDSAVRKHVHIPLMKQVVTDPVTTSFGGLTRESKLSGVIGPLVSKLVYTAALEYNLTDPTLLLWTANACINQVVARCVYAHFAAPPGRTVGNRSRAGLIGRSHPKARTA